MKKLLGLLFISIFFISCGSSFEITKNVSDKDPGIITYTSSVLTVKSEYQVQTFYTELQFFCYQENDKKTFSIAASYTSNQWMYFEKIVFNIDGVEREFLPNRPPKMDVYNLQGPTETITVQVPENVIRDIYESITTEMYVKSSEFFYQVDFKEDMKLKLFEFHKATM